MIIVVIVFLKFLVDLINIDLSSHWAMSFADNFAVAKLEHEWKSYLQSNQSVLQSAEVDKHYFTQIDRPQMNDLRKSLHFWAFLHISWCHTTGYKAILQQRLAAVKCLELRDLLLQRNYFSHNDLKY